MAGAGFHERPEVGGDPAEIADTYLAFWFGVLRDDVDLIEGGQGAAARSPGEG